MTGIEELRHLAQHVRTKSATGYVTVVASHHAIELEIIADQIERELREERDRWDGELCEAQMDKTRVMAVYLEMNRHVSGVEGADDSPVARWARELRRALKSDASDARGAQNTSCHDPAETADVSSEAPKVTRDPADDVSMSAYDLLPEEEREAIAWVREHGGLERVKAQRRESMPRAAYERKKAGFLGHIAECERALRRRNERISELEERVRVRERANDELNEELNAMRPRLMPDGMCWPVFEDGEPVRIGDVVSDVEVRSVVLREDGIILSDCTSVPGWGTWRSYKEPIKRPIADTWERLEEDAEKDPCGYFGFDGEETCGKCPASGKNCEQTMALDIVRRAKKLAGDA